MTETEPELSAVRTEVRKLLQQSPGFQRLSPEEQRRLANDMVRVGAFLADPAWLDSPPAARALAEKADAPPDPIDTLKQRLAAKPGQTGGEFVAGAGREGVEQFGQLVGKVDFPAFVSGLVNGVFRAVVDASMDQMRAYGELLSASAKTVDQFARDHITDAQARDYVRGRYPGAVTIDTSGETSRLRATASEDGESIDLGTQFGMNAPVDLDDDSSELALVNAAKLEMARSRQQLMATMVLLGINRIVVTNGQINAKVVFDMRADDSARRRAEAELNDQAKESSGGASYQHAVIGPWGGGGVKHSSQSHMATVSSAIDDTSESRAELKANLSGEVRLNFKSETFPLERLVDAGGLSVLNERAQPLPIAGAGAPTPGVVR